MTPMPQHSFSPPRWPQVVLRLVLPCDPMRDSIFGDLHEEFMIDSARLGPHRASARYSLRAAGIVSHAVFDSLRWRGWVSTTPPADVAHSPVAARDKAPSGTGLQRLRFVFALTRSARSGAGLGVLALGTLSVGIIANTLLFTSVRTASPAARAGAAMTSTTLGIAAVALSLTCAGVAAVVLCAGPRWLRRRLRRV